MFQTLAYALNGSVALLAEGVDRNFFLCILLNFDARRPPRGGRG